MPTLIATNVGTPTTTAINSTGATLLIGVFAGANTPVFSDSKSNTWTALTSFISSNGDIVKLYYCESPTVGSGHTATVDPGFAAGGLLAFSGMLSSGAYDDQVGNFTISPSGTSLATGSITPPEANCLIIAAVCTGTTPSSTPPTGYTLAGVVAGVSGINYGIGIYYKISPNTDAENPTLEWSGAASAAVVAAVFLSDGTTEATDYSTTLDAGTYNITGQDVTMTYTPAGGGTDYSVTLDAGTYTITGQGANSLYSVAIEAGSYSITGEDLTLTYTPTSGPAAYSVDLEAGTYNITGRSINLLWSGAPSGGGGLSKKLSLSMSIGL